LPLPRLKLRRTIQGNGLSINKEKVTDQEMVFTSSNLISDKYLLVQKGKKNYFLIVVSDK
jgi:tyrosyl-tRNA synthetase